MTENLSTTRKSQSRGLDKLVLRDATTGQFVTVPSAPRDSKVTYVAHYDTVLQALEAARTASKESHHAYQLVVEVDAEDIRILPAGDHSPEPKPLQGPATLDRALDAARARGRDRVAQILAQDDMLTAQELGNDLGMTAGGIDLKRKARQLLALEGAKRGFRYPRWQIGSDGRPFKAMPRLFETLGDSPWAVYRFLVQQHAELDGKTGRQALTDGQDDEALDAARAIGDNFS